MIFGDGTQTMDFVYVDDVARANILAATAPVTDAVYNVGTGTEISLNEVAEVLLRTMGVSLPIEYAPARKVNPVPRRLADTWLAERGDRVPRPRVSFEDGMRRLVAWWRKSPPRKQGAGMSTPTVAPQCHSRGRPVDRRQPSCARSTGRCRRDG